MTLRDRRSCSNSGLEINCYCFSSAFCWIVTRWISSHCATTINSIYRTIAVIFLKIKYDIENPSNDHIKSLSLALSFVRDLLQKNNSDLDQHHLPPPAHEFEPVCTLANQIVSISDGTTTINDTNHDHTIQWHTGRILANNLSETWF